MLTNGPQDEWRILLGVSTAGKIHGRREETFRVETDVGRRRRANLIEFHAADDQERDGDAGLNRRGESMNASDSTSTAARIVLQRRDERWPAETDGGQDAKDERGDEAKSDTRGVGPDI